MSQLGTFTVLFLEYPSKCFLRVLTAIGLIFLQRRKQTPSGHLEEISCALSMWFRPAGSQSRHSLTLFLWLVCAGSPGLRAMPWNPFFFSLASLIVTHLPHSRRPTNVLLQKAASPKRTRREINCVSRVGWHLIGIRTEINLPLPG